MGYTIDLQKIADTLEFDLGDVEMLIEMFIEASTETLVSMQIACLNNDYTEISTTAHSIKGSASNLMLDDIVVVSQLLEHSACASEDIDYTSKYNELKILIDNLKM